MELWEQLLAAVLGLLLIFMFYPSIKAGMEKSKNAEEKHWGTVLLLAAVLIGFIMLLISSV
jgi:uncharacterized membrane protein